MIKPPLKIGFLASANGSSARAILTNLHIDLDFETLRAELPAGVEPGYDGLVFEHEVGD